MATQAEPLKHHDVEKKEDAALAQEAQSHLAKSPAVQLVAELLIELRGRSLSWWTPDGLRTRYTATDRMKWLRDRADVRQRITTSLTGLVPKAARKKDPDFQAGLLDAAVDDGDVTAKAFEEAFDARELAVYGPAGDYWRQFRQRMPWGQDTTVHQELLAFLLKALLTDKGPLGLTRRPILTAWELRTNIPGKIWHTRIPVEIRVAIDDARFEREKAKAKDPFHAKDDLAIALPDVIAANIPLKELVKVLDAAERAMGFELADGGASTSASMRPEATSRESVSDSSPPTVNPSIPPPGTAAATVSTPPAGSVSPPPPPRVTTKGPPPLRYGGPSAQSTPPGPPTGDEPTSKGEELGFGPKGNASSMAPPDVSIQEDNEMLFDVDIGSTEDMSLAGLDKGEERPTKI